MNRIYYCENLPILQALADGAIQFTCIDAPFNTGKVQQRTQLETVRSANGDRTGFQGQRTGGTP